MYFKVKKLNKIAVCLTQLVTGGFYFNLNKFKQIGEVMQHENYDNNRKKLSLNFKLLSKII